MTDTLHALQFEFAQSWARLILQAEVMGYEVTLGDAWRSPEECVRRGKADSVHGLRLAGDLNLFKDGVYLTDSEDHRPLGEWWKREHPEARWGGDFEPDPITGEGGPDGNHYSFEWQGRK